LYSFCIVDRLKQAKLYDLKEKEEIKPPAFLRGFGDEGNGGCLSSIEKFPNFKGFCSIRTIYANVK
jgi:hypothetical protein